jgi:cob(I)alamin adenosyltransferase
MDELNATLGVVKVSCTDTRLVDRIHQIQRWIQDACSDFSLHDGEYTNQRYDDVVSIEAWIDEMDEQLPKLTTFVIPGETPCSASLHLARSVCRRAERACCTIFLNRLSDFLFTAARFSIFTDIVKYNKK